jgi:chromosome segregation ATPase
MSMTPEERRTYDAALAQIADRDASVAKLESELEALRAHRLELDAEVRAVRERAAAAEAQVTGLRIEELIGKKFYPSEREEMLDLAREIGIERVVRMAESRPFIKLMTPVDVAGKPLTSATQPSPPPVDESEVGGSDEIARAALDAARREN